MTRPQLQSVAMQIIAVVLLATVVVTCAGATCLLAAGNSSPIASHHGACHSVPTPFKSHSGAMQCCIVRPAAIPASSVFSPASHPLPTEAVTIDVIAIAHNRVEFPPALVPSSGPPTITALRI